jgi:hypothetical protein
MVRYMPKKTLNLYNTLCYMDLQIISNWVHIDFFWQYNELEMQNNWKDELQSNSKPSNIFIPNNVSISLFYLEQLLCNYQIWDTILTSSHAYHTFIISIAQPPNKGRVPCTGPVRSFGWVRNWWHHPKNGWCHPFYGSVILCGVPVYWDFLLYN